jgi:serine/threonine-protein kinase
MSGATEGLTATDSTLGSPQYMSPEQIRSSKRVDTRTDLWSLGIILHKLLTGRFAFEADSVGAHLIMIVNDPPVPLRQARPDAPLDLERIIARCLQKNLALRYQNVGQLAVALAPFAGPERAPLVEAIVNLVGRDAALAKPPPADLEPDAPTVLRTDTGPRSVPQPVIDSGTAPGWVPTGPPPTQRAALYVGAGLGALTALAIALAVVSSGARSSREAAAAPAPTSPAAAAPSSASTSPAAQTTASASPPPAASADARGMLVEIEPPDAEVEVDGVVIPSRPLHLPARGPSYKVVVRAPGYAPESREVAAEEGARVRFVLRRAGGAAPAPAKKKNVMLETNL